jgi:hypothetical protein
MRKTNLLEKGLTSLINVFSAGILSIPLIWVSCDFTTKKLAAIIIFFLLNLFFLSSIKIDV